MDKIEAKQVLKYRGFHSEKLLYSWQDGDLTCENIEVYIQTLETNYRRKLGLRVKWQDLKSFFVLPDCIKIHTVFYIRDSLTIGTITNPSFDELKYFFDECNKIELANYYTVTVRQFYDFSKKYYFQSNLMPMSEPKMKIVRSDCIVYQFLKAPQPRKRNIF